MASDGKAQLVFPCQPDEITVHCWSDDNWGNMEAEPEGVSTADFRIELKQGGYIYEVMASWNSVEAFGGTAYYSFYAVYDGYAHAFAGEPQTVDDPVSGYCGNTMTTIFLDGAEYTFAGSDSVMLTDILINLFYDPEQVCRCPAEFAVDTEFGSGYQVNLTEGFVRCDDGQADLTQEQAEEIQGIIDRVK